MLHSLPGFVVGGTIGLALSLLLAAALPPRHGTESHFSFSPQKSSPSDPASSPATAPSSAAYRKLSTARKLGLAVQFRGLSAQERQTLLQECLNRPQPERTPLLSLLLTLWAETQPSAAADWILANLKKPEAPACLNDVLRTWAAHDGQSLAEWTDAHSQRIGREIISNAMTALEQHSPFWFAQLTGMECNRNTEWSGMRFDSLRELGAAKALSPQLAAHVAYSTDPAKLAKPEVEAWDEPQKWGWNRLFERTAIYWHAEDPAACDAWLETFPDNARQAARRSIEEEARANQKASASNSDSQSSADNKDPNTAGSNPPEPSAGQPSESASAESLPTAAEPNLTDAPQQIQAWGQWWQRDAKAADAFLQNSAWSDSLKFRARAAAFASPLK